MFAIKNDIKKVVTSIVILVFLIDVTPKQYFHYLFAYHSDQKITADHQHKSNISKSGFHCNCNDQVAESTFSCISSGMEDIIPLYQTKFLVSNEHLITSYLFDCSDRGPPSMI